MLVCGGRHAARATAFRLFGDLNVSQSRVQE